MPWLGIQDRILSPEPSAEFLGFPLRRSKLVLTVYFVLNKKGERCITSSGTAEFHFFSCLGTSDTTTHPATAPRLLHRLPRYLFLHPPPHRAPQEQQLPSFDRGLSPRVSLKARCNVQSVVRTGQGFNQCYQKGLISPCFQELQHHIFIRKKRSGWRKGQLSSLLNINRW